MKLLHLSADYPDPLEPSKTKAIFNLLALADGHEHRVLSINRVGWRKGIWGLDFADPVGHQHRAVSYGAPPKGLLLTRYLERLAAWLIEDCRAAGYRPDIVHAHKLSIEGLVGEILAAAFDVPLVLSIQGNSDLKIIGARRDLKARYAGIWQSADAVFPFAPWAERGLARLLGQRTGKTVMLPCPGPAETRHPPVTAPPLIATVFHLRDAANKNAEGLIKAVTIAAREIPDLKLEIVGGGDASAFADLASFVSRTAPGRVELLGPIPHSDIQVYLNKACAFALLSFRESFGMVFTEALLAGTPCLIPKDRAIYGYFDEGSVVLSADPGSPQEIAKALVRLVREQEGFKARLRKLGEEGDLDFLRQDSIRAAYLDTLNRL